MENKSIFYWIPPGIRIEHEPAEVGCGLSKDVVFLFDHHHNDSGCVWLFQKRKREM